MLGRGLLFWGQGGFRQHLPIGPKPNNRQMIGAEAFKGTHPLAPSLKKGGGMNSWFPSVRNPSLF
jgi:hypothetical protein